MWHLANINKESVTQERDKFSWEKKLLKKKKMEEKNPAS